jgi:hypothetical protein
MATQTFTVSLTEAELTALEYEVGDINEWLQGFLKSRASITMDSMFMQEVTRRLQNNEPINGTKEDILNHKLPSYNDRKPKLAGPLEAAPTVPTPSIEAPPTDI